MTPSGTTTSVPTTLGLRSLRPNYVEAEHGLYVSLLVADITGASPSQNIAVSGAYGSGKSSVLEGLLGELVGKEVNAIQISLATLNQSRAALLEVSGEATLTSALEKEVVKRLLYSATPAQIPRSRFNRIGGFRPGPAAGLAAVTGVLVAGVAETVGASLPAAQIVEAFDWWRWTAPALDAISVGALAFGGQAALSSFRLSEITVGPARLSLDDKDGNYFDHFLDEIIYFFQRTKTSVVLFEDLDRFDDPGIFLALRELNNLLNGSQQIIQRVTFVHAIRDSLFVQTLDSGNDDPGAKLPDAHARHGADTAASDRAKFFDLIVPVVPFISHEVAADLLLNALDDLPGHLKPSRALIGLVGRHFADMRVILSIRNEYEVFAAELLTKSAVRGLTADQLFAIIVYKHVYLDDFERIRTGESLLDATMDSIRAAVGDMVSAADSAIAETENMIEAGAAVDERAKSAGERLLEQLDLGLRFRGWQGVQTVTVSGTRAFSRAEVTSRDFWITLAEADKPKLQLQSPNGGFEVASADVTALLGPDRNPKIWTRSQLQRDRRRLAALVEARSWLRTATFSQLLTGPFPQVAIGDTQPWTRIATACTTALGEGLPYELMRAGHLDQNFALYTTKFHGALLSAQARSYMMQYADRHRSEPLFVLGGTDVDEILGRLGDAFLDDPSALNVAVVDRLLETNAPRLPLLVETTSQATEFVYTYLANGRFRDDLMRRIAPLRADVLDIVASAVSVSENDRRSAASECLSVLSSGLDYSVSAETAEFLGQALDDLPVLRSVVEPDVASAIASLLSSTDLKVVDLGHVAEPLRAELASSGSFVINRSNLGALTGDPGKVGLDTLGGLGDGVGRHLVEHLSQYLDAVTEAPRASVVDEPARLDEVVRAVVGYDESLLGSALSALRKGIEYDDLASAPEHAYRDLARHGAFKLTRSNVTRYIESVGTIDESLAAHLTDVARIDVAGPEHTDEEESARLQLATQLVATDQLRADAKLGLVGSLRTKTTLDVAELRLTDPNLAAELLAAGEIAEDTPSFNGLLDCPWPVFEACASTSARLADFVQDLAFTDDSLGQTLASTTIPEGLQKKILTNFEAFESLLGSAAATAWLAASERLRMPLTAPRLIALAGAGATTAALIESISSGSVRLTATDLVGVLQHCAGPYSGLAQTSGATFAIPHSEPIRKVLQTLKAGGVVKEFRKKRRSAEFEVVMQG